MRSTRSFDAFCYLAIGVAILVAPLRALAEGGGLDITGPTIAPPTVATQPTPVPTTASTSGVTVATAPATMPTAQSVLDNLLHQPPAAPVLPATSTNPVATPAIAGSAPNQPEVNRLREGQFVYNRVGRLVKDEKSGQWLIAFEADGKDMKDPPMGLLPCRLLASMENLSENGGKSVKFKVSGQVTEYHGKNYLLITFMQTVKDLNQF